LRSPSRPFTWLLRKEWRELMASRSWWLMLLLIGPLVGMSFIGAVRTYGELSGVNGTASGVGEAFSPLVGIWAPTFSAWELAAAFLLPFVAIRLVSGDRQSGALKLELQHPMPAVARISAKSLVLLAAWLVASIPALIAILLWKVYGGPAYAPELAAVLAGHLLNAGLTVALACATASITDHPSTAAILTLGVTVGTWILNFVAAVHGGLWDRAASYTPTAMVAEFQHGLVRLDAVLVACTLIALGCGLGAIWMRLGVPERRRVGESLTAGVVALVAIVVFARVTPSWDASEALANSFSRPDETTLARIPGPLRIDVHLAPEDPRRVDLEQRALSKLRRVRPDVQVRYTAASSTGLFEQTSEHYGEIWYELSDRKVISRVTTADGVLGSIYEVAGLSPPALAEEDIFRGHPLAAEPKGAAVLFYGIWPAAVGAAAFWHRRRNS
jgi:ABC-type transport system involved in multi-copper enzyme maturation permease subunit